MDTLTMLNLAKDTGKTYQSSSIAYSREEGFYEKDLKEEWQRMINRNHLIEFINNVLDESWEEVINYVSFDEAFKHMANGGLARYDGSIFKFDSDEYLNQTQGLMKKHFVNKKWELL